MSIPIPLDCLFSTRGRPREEVMMVLVGCSFIINEDDDNYIGETVSFILFTPF